MGRAKIVKPDSKTFPQEKRALLDRIGRGEMTIGQATRAMRQLLGMTQKEYAEKVAGISYRILMDIEKDRHNPALKTLRKIGQPFGLGVGFVLPGADKSDLENKGK